jgi:hypothetical protein
VFTHSTKTTALFRVLVGMVQGFALYGLYSAGKNHTEFASNALLFAPLVLVALFLPILFVVSLGHLSRKALLYWMLALLLALTGLAVYDQWRNIGALSFNGWNLSSDNSEKTKYPSFLLYAFTAVSCFITHSLVSAACSEGKRIASYNAYFDTSWKLLVQLKFSTIFVGALMLVLFLGANLFQLIKINFLHDALQESWFVIPICMTAFSFALNLTDVRPAIVNSIRNLLLVLLSWILPLAVVLIGGFLLTLPFTGLSNLWATKRAASIVLFSVAALVVLINTAFQNGSLANQVPVIIKYSAKVASILLLPLTALAAYALGLRVAEYGWTTDRIIAASCVLVAACYALGYLWAAIKSPEWLADIAKVNIVCAVLVVGLILSLFSPLLDPARISVNDQVKRLHSGVQSVETFDFAYLKFDGKRFGAQALSQLALNKEAPNSAEIGKKIDLVLAQTYKSGKYAQPVAPNASELAANLTAYPKGTVLPESFLKQDWSSKNTNNNWGKPDCFVKRDAKCDVIAVDVNGDGVNELLVIGHNYYGSRSTIFQQNHDQSWTNLGELANFPRLCDAQVQQLKLGQFALKTPVNKDIEIGGQRYAIHATDAQTDGCKDSSKQK